MTLRNAAVFYDWSQASLANFSGGLLRISNHELLYWCAIGASTLPEIRICHLQLQLCSLPCELNIVSKNFTSVVLNPPFK